MASTALRDRQVELTRDLILQALVDTLAEGRLAEFSVPDIAERAGVSLRTIYRHFPTREALLDGLVPWAEQRMRAQGGMDLPKTADDISTTVKAKFAALEALGPLFAAVVKLDSATRIRSEQAVRGLVALREALADDTADLEPEVAEAVVWTIRQICSVKTWLVLHEEGGIDAQRAGKAAAWAVEVLLTALRDGRGPSGKEDLR